MTKTKRPHGSGSISRTKSGTWRALATIQGKRLSFTAKTQREAAAWLRKITSQVEQGLTYDSAQTTFSELLGGWLEIKASKLRPATVQQYRNLTRLYLAPGLGELALKDLSAARIQAFYGQLQEQGTGRRTIEVVHTILHGALKHARRLGLIAQNWCELVEVPRPEKREMQVWDESQVARFIQSLEGYPDQLFFRLAFANGMRRGELLGLRWDDLDWRAGTISIRRQVFRPEGGGFLLQEPKSARGRRVIRVGPGTLEALRAHFNETLPLARVLAGDRWEEHGLIFPNTIGKPRQGKDVSKRFSRLAKAAGLPRIRFHDIRHTAASIMLLHGEPPVRVAAILGQSVAILLARYAHYIPDDQERAALLMDAITTPVELDLGAIAPGSRRDANQIAGNGYDD